MGNWDRKMRRQLRREHLAPVIINGKGYLLDIDEKTLKIESNVVKDMQDGKAKNVDHFGNIINGDGKVVKRKR